MCTYVYRYVSVIYTSMFFCSCDQRRPRTNQHSGPEKTLSCNRKWQRTPNRETSALGAMHTAVFLQEQTLECLGVVGPFQNNLGYVRVLTVTENVISAGIPVFVAAPTVHLIAIFSMMVIHAANVAIDGAGQPLQPCPMICCSCYHYHHYHKSCYIQSGSLVPLPGCRSLLHLRAATPGFPDLAQAKTGPDVCLTQRTSRS